MSATATARKITSEAPAGRPDLSIRVNVGCGTNAPDGWYNIDNSPSVFLSRLPWGQRLFRTPAWPRNVRRHDVLKGLPFADKSVDFVYSSHTFEHFTYPQSLALAKECFRILKPNGLMRISVPGLEHLVRDYLADRDSMASHTFIRRLILGHTWRDMLHPGSHHSQMFDTRSLMALLRDAGFPSPRPSEFGESCIPDLLLLEPADRRRESIYVEAEKTLPGAGQNSAENA